MANITQDDMRLMAGQIGLTVDDVSRSAIMDTASAECNRCGTCCRTQNGIVLSLDDIFRISERLGLTPKNFIRKHCRDSRAYDVFGRGPFPGLSIATKKGICPFFKDGEGCTINDVKPLVCRLYPFNTVHVTRASLFKMQRMKDDERYSDCYIFDFPNNSVMSPDFKALAVNHIHMSVTREYYTRYDGKWHEDLARQAMEEGKRLAGDGKVLAQLECQLREAFEALDRRNVEMLAEVLR
jgi:Fe-S-cluster containining protein